MNGLLGLRAQGNQLAAVAARMRLGHIPAGSTDAVAYSINGTRSQLTATLHIALGDRSSLDIEHVSFKQRLQGMLINEHMRDAVSQCFAAYWCVPWVVAVGNTLQPCPSQHL